MSSMKPLNRRIAVLLLGGGSIGALFGAGVLHNQWVRAEQHEVTQQQLSQAENLATVFRDVGKQVEPAVVEIQVHKTIKAPKGIPLPDDMLRRFFPDQPGLPQSPNNDENDGEDGGGPSFEQVGTGSGFIVEVDGSTGYILTNNHVAGGASDITVRLADGRRIDDAKLVGADPKTDLAVVKIQGDDLKPARMGDSSSIQQGDWIVAFGAPFGYVGSMTHGIVSALNRSEVGILGSQGYEDFIQVDAPINPGNSGGPLVNLRGEVVGINTAIASHNGGFQGIGFAIPVNEAKWIYSQLKEHGKVTRGWLGVAIGDVAHQPDVAKSLGYDKGTGVIVEAFTGNSPANGKLHKYDVITEVNGKSVESITALRNAIAQEAPGNSIRLTVFRDGKNEQVSVKLGEQPENMLTSHNEIVPPRGTAPRSTESLGMRLATPGQQLAEKFGLPDNSQGAVVTFVAPRSTAERAGLQVGDLITEVDRKPVKSAQEASNLIAKHSGKGAVLLYVESANADIGGHIVAVEPPKK